MITGSPGSSPRVWGIRLPPGLALPSCPVHPHACGEYGIFCRLRSCGRSVHPHACGEYTTCAPLPSHRARFIPTRVGNTSLPSLKLRTDYGSSPRVWGIRGGRGARPSEGSVHPHACGEYDRALYHTTAANRFIPTRVGNTKNTNVDNWYLNGSSPRVWGIRRGGQRPAAAPPVHPHACGEYEGAAPLKAGV